jgi:hypothetical protein
MPKIAQQRGTQDHIESGNVVSPRQPADRQAREPSVQLLGRVVGWIEAFISRLSQQRQGLVCRRTWQRRVANPKRSVRSHSVQRFQFPLLSGRRPDKGGAVYIGSNRRGEVGIRPLKGDCRPSVEECRRFGLDRSSAVDANPRHEGSAHDRRRSAKAADAARGCRCRQPRRGGGRRHATFTSIAFGFTFSALGTCTFNTPFLNSAVTRLGSTSIGRPNRRTNVP